MNKKGISLFVGILIFLFITAIIISLIVFFYLSNQRRIDDKIKDALTPDKKYYKVSIIAENTLNKQVSANFTLMNDNKKILYGNLYPSRIETYDRIEDNETYYLHIWNDNYYMNISKLNASDWVFSGKMQPYGVPKIDTAKIGDFSYILKFSSDNGFFRKPIICEKHTYNILFVKIDNVTEVEIPELIRESQDHCYSFDTIDYNSFKTFNMTVVPYSLLNVTDTITFTLIDKVQFYQADVLRDYYFFEKTDLGVKNIQRTISVY